MGCFDAVREKTDKLVLVSGTPKFIKDETFPHGLSKALFRNLERKIQADLDSGLRFFYDLVGINFSARFKKDEILESLDRLKKEDLRPLLPKIDVPVLLIHGDKDRICSVEASKYMAEVIPDARLVVFKGVGHAPFIEQPEKFKKIVEEFLAC
ncbi:hypothetical protein A2276_02075 [candidate division WOR-1 bacterium RIFOXYA12_FULL_43_27]|uniref:AB hydrolase-1 domain-containing protein n=1 Tax=candidate division WOR-1 bacterium RIFOXYC2_FULL_46_14 TaxID=1802587 RepID=A0A1F4U6P7_UNCSA|nr:MAG: hypothetical protein A2276_02075 [candidate division WOR-1 bacterium RIFOXYA12_FULL_43_27]OGC19491.1 MAG: hypothetical protein A2292_02255 [candidate division WOR-1 bacterium RIFOXYB2_FULL_46_45]OGC30479.1 MAG: hypothetical protein A2232_02255 [candidate division WOR-1 bacterium RIFOXYA2_FULL_46_56]OGC40547.1 MAG: hypothetical protein A2438_05970 [candidate division WOR-1 bacterium RIFOXYC2_FULL_46_14]